MEDRSVLSQSSGAINNQGINEYANECIKEVCLKGDSLSKYQKQIEKKFGEAFYNKCDDFVKEVQRSIESKKFSNTSVINLKHLAKEIGIPVETVDIIKNHYYTIFVSNPPIPIPDPPLPPEVPGEKGSGNSKWIIILLIAILGVGCYIAFNQNRDTPESSYNYNSSNSNQAESSYSSSQEPSSSYSSGNQSSGSGEQSYSSSNSSTSASNTDRDTEYEELLSRRELTESDLAGKSNYELRKMVNRIYAHNGYIFSKDEWRNYFSQFSWYSPSTSDQTTVYNRFSSIERYNVDFIKRHE